MNEFYYLLDQALCDGNVLVVKGLLAAGVDIQRPMTEGTTPLKIVVERGYSELVEILLKAGADPNSGHSEDILELAALVGNSTIVQMLIQSGARVSPVNCIPLKIAAYTGNLEIVQLLIESGADANSYSQEHLLPLVWAAKEGHEAVFQYLSALTESSLQQSLLTVALHLAASEGKLQSLKIFSTELTGLDSKDSSGRTALMLAVEQKQLQFALALLSLGVDINAQDFAGRTALMIASQSGSLTMIRHLLQAGADVNIRDFEGNSALFYARQISDKTAIQLLEETKGIL